MPVRAENTHLNEMPDRPDRNVITKTMNYGALLVVADYSGEPFSLQQQEQLAKHLTESSVTGLRQISIDTDPGTGFMEVASIVDAKDEADALDVLAHGLLRALAASSHDPEYIQLVETHLAYEEQLKADQPATEPIDAITIPDYTVDQIATFEVTEIGEQVIDDPRRIFYTAREDVIDQT